MNLQAREISEGMNGEDVGLLHRELTQLGFTIPRLEGGRQFFGQRTVEAVKEFQRSRGLRAGGRQLTPHLQLSERTISGVADANGLSTSTEPARDLEN